MNSHFALKELDLVSYFLGIKVTRTESSLHLCQSKYIQDILKKTNMADCKGSSTPMCVGHKLSKYGGDPFPDPTLYRSTIGSLQYVTITRPEIAFAINKLSQFLEYPSMLH